MNWQHALSRSSRGRSLSIFLLGTITFGCHADAHLTRPGGTATITLEIVLADEAGGPSTSTGTRNSASAIENVVVSVRNAATNVPVAGQQLTIQGGFAEGDIDIPVVGTQSFIITVTADDPQTFMVFGGFTFATLEEGEVRSQPVEILISEVVDISQQGAAQASSTFNQDPAFSPSQGTDGDFATSWFSAGASDGDTSTFTWTAPREVFLQVSHLVDNSFHNNPGFRTGFGFNRVTLRVFSGPNATGTMRFEETFDYPSGPDDVPTQILGVPGRSVHLILEGHEDHQCGGFGELILLGTRP